MSERLNKTSVCTVIFVGIVDYAQMPVDDQIVLKERFNALINEAVSQVAQNDRIILDTGEGAAIALLGAPEEALDVAVKIRDGVLQDRLQYPERAISVRIGINLGPVRVVNDLNDRLNVVGDGINAAQRVMSFAQPDRILVSRSYFEIASRLSSELADMFHYSGVKTDKFVREHEVYSVLEGEAESVLSPMKEDPVAPVVMQPSSSWMKTFALYAFGSFVALALAWGYWITRPAESEAVLKTTAKQGDVQTVAEEAENIQDDTPQENRKSRPKRKQVESAKAVAHQEPLSDSSPSAEISVKRVAEPPPPESAHNSLCSDAQRMLKQC